MTSTPPKLPDAEAIRTAVRHALEEDVGSGDVTANLVPADSRARARVIAREPGVLCGTAWFDAVYRELDPGVAVQWSCRDGGEVAADTVICRLDGPARPLLTGERTALNFLQLLSGTATFTRRCVKYLEGSRTRLLDTRKTIPGLRVAQKYAVACGGGQNHRMGLYDAVLIKENHIRAAGGIAQAVKAARATGLPVEVEVTSLQELDEALAAGATRIMLDNFQPSAMREAVSRAAGRAELEVSGGVAPERLPDLAATGIDFISMGALTKNVRAIDFSMLFEG